MITKLDGLTLDLNRLSDETVKELFSQWKIDSVKLLTVADRIEEDKRRINSILEGTLEHIRNGNFDEAFADLQFVAGTAEMLDGILLHSLKKAFLESR
jgi:hypothetical protein